MRRTRDLGVRYVLVGAELGREPGPARRRGSIGRCERLEPFDVAPGFSVHAEVRRRVSPSMRAGPAMSRGLQQYAPGRGAAMAKHDVIVIGASAGGVEAIIRVVAELPRDIRASIFVVLHISRGRSMLPEILTRAGRLPAAHPTDGEPLQYGRIYVAPPDHHMVVQLGAVRIVHTASENGVRPAVDPLFRSAARVYGARVLGVVLTGALDDGTAGIAAIKDAGGVTIAQDPDEAFSPGMPRSAINTGMVDHILALRDIPLLLAALVEEEAAEMRPATGT